MVRAHGDDRDGVFVVWWRGAGDRARHGVAEDQDAEGDPRLQELAQARQCRAQRRARAVIANRRQSNCFERAADPNVPRKGLCSTFVTSRMKELHSTDPRQQGSQATKEPLLPQDSQKSRVGKSGNHAIRFTNELS